MVVACPIGLQTGRIPKHLRRVASVGANGQRDSPRHAMSGDASCGMEARELRGLSEACAMILVGSASGRLESCRSGSLEPMTTSADTPDGEASPIYQSRVLAYVDILGWSDLILKSASDPSLLPSTVVPTTLFGLIREINEVVRMGLDLGGIRSSGTDVSHFSDTIVWSCVDTSPLLPSLISLVKHVCGILLAAGCYTRGAVTVGKLHHSKDALFGPALIEAHCIERSVAKYPRVVVTDDAKRIIQSDSIGPEADRPPIRQDFDGLWYLDFLSMGQSNLDSVNSANAKKQKMRNETLERLKADAADLGRVAKHWWMLRYLDASLVEGDVVVPPSVPKAI